MIRMNLTICFVVSVGAIWLISRPLRSGTEALNSESDTRSAEMSHITFSRQFMGMHTLSPTRHWPDVNFGSIRPAGVTWGALEPAKGQYDWRSLDSWISQSRAVQFTYVFLNTPRWASTRPNEPCNGGRLGCAAPPDLNDWDEFVRALVTRYKGRISSYEMWNEPNASGFWSGSIQDMVELAAHAYPIIKSIDPSAIVTTPSASSTGWPLSHDAWLDQYLTAGGDRFSDVIAWHGYAGRNDRPALPPELLVGQIEALHTVLARHRLSRIPIWDTEGGWGKDTQLPDEGDQASFLIKWYVIQFTSGIGRAYWYQWDNPLWGTLWLEGSGLTPAGAAYRQVAGWLEGATAASPCRPAHATTLWTCDFRKGSVLYRIAWSASGETSFPIANTVVALTELGGIKQVPDGRPVLLGSRPVLFQIREDGAQ